MDMKDGTLDQFVPIHIATQRCGEGNHSHMFLGTVSNIPPYPGETAWVNDDTGEFFFPFVEFIQWLN